MRSRSALILLFILAGPVLAHEFWLQPRKHQIRKGESIDLRFMVGENFEGENWKGTQASVQSLKLYYGNIEDNLKGLLGDSEGDSLRLQFFDEGTVLVSYRSTNKYIELEPDKFLAYLKEDGLQNAITYREGHGETDSVGRENYQRCAKTFFQVGALKDDVYKKNCGLPLEFIPLQHPYSGKGEKLGFRLLFNELPAKETMVKVWKRANGKTEKTEVQTDRDGNIYIPRSTGGRNMISAVIMERLAPDSSAQWQSYWATLTW